MTDSIPSWWVTAVEIPIFIACIGVFWKVRREIMYEVAVAKNLACQSKDMISDFKLEVAHKYASVGQVNEIEKRLTSHLLRIEFKLENRHDSGVSASKGVYGYDG
ncbi:MAG: hypothetical protein FWF01_00850 [Alphaproteobacteria bacterium]|nr:hypothetical protein [Alphaproteobacteria bacterium]